MVELKLVEAIRPRELSLFRHFVSSLYSGDSGWVASSLFILDIFLKRKDSFCREAQVRPIMICRGRQICAVCILVYHPGLPVLQVAFFEALAQQRDSVDLILNSARELARQLKCVKLVVGLNGHLAYGVGIMTEGWGRPISFDSIFGKQYYAEYFRNRGMQEFPLSSYEFDPREIDRRFGKLSRAYRQFDFRPMNRRRWREEMELFGDLANRSLSHTRYYFERPPYQLNELMTEMKFLMKSEYLIFVMDKQKEVGLIFWHPDFNEVLPPGRTQSILQFGLRHLLRQKPYETIKVNFIGLLPQYRGTGAVIGLFMMALRYSGLNYKRLESNFVWDCNVESRRFNLELGGQVARRYSVFCEELVGENA
jgi:hypothetical protein